MGRKISYESYVAQYEKEARKHYFYCRIKNGFHQKENTT